MTQKAITSGFRTFLLIWFGQLISLTGTGLTGFALGVWVYQRTGSVTQFALIAIATTLPGILFSPIAGALVDRWDRRWAMFLSDAGASLCTLSMCLLLFVGRLQVWEIYIAMAISSTITAFQWPAYSAATTLLVPKEHLGRASGMVQIAEAVAQIGSPAIAGVMMGIFPIFSILLVDFVTYLFALFTLLITRFPKPETTAESKARQGSLLREAAFGWTYIVARPGLLGLLLYFASANFVTGFAQVLFTPLVLSLTTPAVLGLIWSVGGIGFLVGSLAMSLWGGPRQRILGILCSGLLEGVVLLIIGFPPRVIVFATAVFLFFLAEPVIGGCSQATWQVKTPPDVQGRVFAVRRMIAWSSLPLSYLLAGPLADHVFTPLLVQGGPLANSVGRIIGVGPGRGIALFFVIMGILLIAASGVGFLYPRLRRLELELPDVITSKSPAPTAE
jgi:DHA3 family macrolide efflux protein-like MFS transporter